jgi:hypothetical protein
MLQEKQVNQVPPVPNSMSVAELATSYWVQEGSLGAGRQAIIHLGDCPLCDEGRNAKGQDRWYGPFTDLIAARDVSDQLSDLAMRSECRCVRKNAAQDLPTLALLNEPLFRKPNPKPAAKAKEVEKEKAKEQEPRKSARVLAAEAKARKAKRSKTIRYSSIGVAAAIALAVWIFVIPAVSVVEAANHGATAPFLLTNRSPLTLNNVQAECTVELQPSVVHSHNGQQLTDTLDSKGQVTVPCFQAVGGATPQVRGAMVKMTVRYDVFGIRHVEQDFAFVAARTPEGYAKWVLKGQS